MVESRVATLQGDNIGKLTRVTVVTYSNTFYSVGSIHS